MNETSDFVVIGAAVMGASIACHLAERRAGTVTVLEKAAVASGASGWDGPDTFERRADD